MAKKKKKTTKYTGILKNYCGFSNDVTKIQTKKTIDPIEILLS